MHQSQIYAVTPEELKTWGCMLRQRASRTGVEFVCLAGSDGSDRFEWERDPDGDEFLSFIPQGDEKARQIWVFRNNDWIPLEDA